MPEANPKNLIVGFDVGSTTVKSVVVDASTDQILWSDYQRHDTKQPEKCLEFLKRMETEAGIKAGESRVFITGSGGGPVGVHIGAKFVQEVNAVSLAVEKLYPECGSVVELGGQDAKIIIFKEDPETGRKKKIPSMNDKCAGGTGAVIDKINAKLRIPAEELCNMGYLDLKLHPVAGKCGVFAETDINGLQKSGVPPSELMASLFEAIIQQNLAVLTRGNTLRPTVLLLGGPNTYIKGMQDCWKFNIPRVWEERNFPLPEGVDPKDTHQKFRTTLNISPPWAACGLPWMRMGKSESTRARKSLSGTSTLAAWKRSRSAAGSAFARAMTNWLSSRSAIGARNSSPTPQAGQHVEAFMGINGGSTSTKAVLISHEGEVMVKCYQLSKGNPLEDTMEMFANLRSQVESQGATVELLGVGSNGYAKDILKDVLNADVALVETVAHTQAALHFYPKADVICDVGGQDIKLIILQDGRVKDFKLNTQCSAGNGYFLQSTCVGFGHDVKAYADLAFGAKAMPMFGYGCAVFMQSDIVDFQRQGWKPEEDHGRPRQRLAQEHLALRFADSQHCLARRHLHSAGRNAAQPGGAVKAQVDFIESRFKDKGQKPNVIVHEHCGEAGAIGAGIEARRLYNNGHRTNFIGFDAVRESPTLPIATRHALLLLQEQVHAHLHRRADRELRRVLEEIQDSHTGRREAADRGQQLREGPGRRRRRHARNQEGSGRGQEGIPHHDGSGR